jgi:hypothetical protein
MWNQWASYNDTVYIKILKTQKRVKVVEPYIRVTAELETWEKKLKINGDSLKLPNRIVKITQFLSLLIFFKLPDCWPDDKGQMQSIACFNWNLKFNWDSIENNLTKKSETYSRD